MADKIDVTPDRDGGVMKEILTPGHGGEFPANGNKVSVHYVGTLESGEKFDSSRDRGDLFEFTLGKGEVIKAWDLGVATMKKGEKSRLYCHYKYAYGEAGMPPKIPEKATLIFEVELFSWKGEDLTTAKDGGIVRTTITPGEGSKSPNDGATVEIHIKGTVNETVFDERDVKFNLGEGTEENIPEGLEKALEKFKMKEKSIIKLSPKYTFGSAGKPEIGIPPSSNVEYEVTLNDFENAKESWDMNPLEKLEQSRIHKEKGNKYFKEQKYRLAVKQYIKVTELMDLDLGFNDEEEKKENHALKNAGNLNLAACYLKLKEYGKVREFTTKVIENDPTNVKAYFRRGQGYESLEDSENAIKDYEKCISLDPSNATAKKQLKACKAKIIEYKNREKQIYSGMFDKFARTDLNKAKSRRSAVLKDGVGEWEEGEKEEEKEGDLSEVKLLSTGDDIKGDELNMAST